MASSPSNSLKLQTNLPEVIALSFTDGLPVSSPFSGDQIRFTLTDGRTWYAHPAVAAKVHALDLQVGELFSVCKREVTHGNRRTVEYQVERVSGAAGVEAPAVAAVESSSQSPKTEQHQHNSIHAVPAPAAVPAAFAAHKLADCFTSAVDVALGAVAYAKAQGLLLSPTFEDIRAMAATLHISESRNSQRVAEGGR